MWFVISAQGTLEHDLWHNHTKVACFGANICKIMGIEGPILNCGSCLRTRQPSARPGGGQRCRYRGVVDAVERGGGSCPVLVHLRMDPVSCLLHGNGAGLTASTARYPYRSSCAALASPLALSGQSYHRPCDMAITLWQSAPSAAAALLKGRLHRTVPGQVIVDSWSNHG